MSSDSLDQPVFDESQFLKRGLVLSEALKASLPPRIDPETISTRAKIPFKALCMRDVMLYRVSELADAALACYQRDQLVLKKGVRHPFRGARRSATCSLPLPEG